MENKSLGSIKNSKKGSQTVETWKEPMKSRDNWIGERERGREKRTGWFGERNEQKLKKYQTSSIGIGIGIKG